MMGYGPSPSRKGRAAGAGTPDGNLLTQDAINGAAYLVALDLIARLHDSTKPRASARALPTKRRSSSPPSAIERAPHEIGSPRRK